MAKPEEFDNGERDRDMKNLAKILVDHSKACRRADILAPIIAGAIVYTPITLGLHACKSLSHYCMNQLESGNGSYMDYFQNPSEIGQTLTMIGGIITGNALVALYMSWKGSD